MGVAEQAQDSHSFSSPRAPPGFKLTFSPTTTTTTTKTKTKTTLTGLPQALRVVFVMIKGLGNHMEPASSPATSVNEHKQHLFVNSDLVSLSLVGAPPDQAHKSVKVDLSAPIELLFRHLDNNHDQWDLQPTWPTNRQQQQATRPPRCVYWDTTIR